MKTRVAMRVPSDGEDPQEQQYLEKIRKFGKHYKEFKWPSVQALLNFLRFYDMLWGHFSKLMRGYGLSPAVFNTLMILRQHHGEKIKQQDISKLLLVSRANVTGLVMALVRRGLAKRAVDSYDRRAWRVQITAKGEALLGCYFPAHYREVHRVFADMDPGEIRCLNDLFCKLKRGVRKCSEMKYSPQK